MWSCRTVRGIENIYDIVYNRLLYNNELPNSIQNSIFSMKIVLVVVFYVFGIYETVIWECWTVVSRRVHIV